MERSLRGRFGNRGDARTILGLILLSVPAFVWLGWSIGNPYLMGLGTNLPPMNPVSALCFAVLGLRMLLGTRPRALAARDLLALTVVSVGLMGVVTDLLHLDWPLDQMIFRELVLAQPEPIHVAFSTAICFVLLGSASICSERNSTKLRVAAQCMAMVCGLVAIFYLNSYALSRVGNADGATPMALNTAALQLVGAATVLAATSQVGLMGVISAPTLSAKIARHLLWVALILPFVLSFGFERLSDLAHVSVAANVGVLVTLVAAAFVVTIWVISVPANRHENHMRAVQAQNLQTMHFFRTILDSVPGPISVKNREGVITMANQACADLFGVLQPDDLVGIHAERFISDPGQIAALRQGDQEVLATGFEVAVPPTQVLYPDGTKRWLQINKGTVPSLGGRELHILTVAADVTARMEKELRFEAALGEIRDLYDNAPCGYHSLDPDGLVVEMNNTELEWLGYTREEVIGRIHFSDLIPADYVDKFWANFQRFKDSGTLQELEATMVRKDGSHLPVVVTSKAVRDEEGRYMRNRTTMFDLTEHQAAEQQIRQARDDAERANRAKSEFLSRMSHELRTPLNAILGFAQMLQLEKHGDRVDQSVHHILKGGRHLLRMINEILDLSRIDAGNLSVSLEPVQLAAVIRDAADFIKPLARSQGISIEFDAGPEEERFVLGDQQQLKQVCLNLLSNAIKYNVDSGRVAISIRVADGHVQVLFADTGIGVDPSKASDLFSPFARLGAENTGVEGTGLGLALSQRLAQSMRGQISYRANEPQGSVFTVELETAESKTSVAIEEIPNNPTGAGTGRATRQILLIEDNLSNVELMSRILESREDIELLSAMSGALGLDIAKHHCPDLVLLDVNLPDTSGLDVLRALKQIPETKSIPVVVTSADATEKLIRTMLAEGAVEYLTKPLDVARIFQVIDENLTTEPKVA
jgi:PAS domain S-box-containing protein